MKTALRTVTRILKKLIGFFPLTPLGVVVLGGALAASLYIVAEKRDFVLNAAVGVPFVLTAASVFMVLVGAGVAALRLGRESGLPEAFDADTQIETSFTLPSFTYWPLLRLEVGWESPRHVELETVRLFGKALERVTVKRRGRYPGVERRFVVRDVFGLASFSFSWRWEQPFVVRPAKARADMAMTLRHSGGDTFSHPHGERIGELIEMRRYAHGDPMRMILWKTFARTRRLLVRMPEAAISPKPSTAAFLIAGPEDEPTASLARLFLEQGYLGDDFVFSADGSSDTTGDPHEAVDQIIGSAGFEDLGGDGLETFMRAVDHTLLNNCVVFAPGQDGPWVDRLVGFARALPVPPTVILAVDGVLETPERGTLSRLLRAPEQPSDLKALSHLPKLYDRLRSAGMEVKIVHRPTGQLFHDTQLNALRAA